MKVCLKGVKNSSMDVEVLKFFFQFLQSEMSLKEDILVNFTNERKGKMTTGVRHPDEIVVLAKDRMFIDVLRTLSHEWVHEYQHQIMGIPDEQRIQDIGGPEENMASALSSIFMKKFQKEYPQFDEVLYKKIS